MTPTDIQWQQITGDDVAPHDTIHEATTAEGYILGSAFSPDCGPWAYATDANHEGFDSICIAGASIPDYIANGKLKAVELLQTLRAYKQSLENQP